jgi:hypothetical protein
MAPVITRQRGRPLLREWERRACAVHQIVAEVLEQKFDGHLEEMAQEQGIPQTRELAALFPATDLRRAGVPQEGCELFAGDTALGPGDPESIVGW